MPRRPTVRHFKHCPHCGARLAYRRTGPQALHPRCTGCGFVFYQSSKITAGVLITDGDQVLLARRGIQPYQGYWDIPGGFLEPGEHPEAGARREIKEELNAVIGPLTLVGVFMDEYGSGGDPTLNFFYTTPRRKGRLAAAQDDVAEIRWFPVSRPPARLAFTCVRRALAALRGTM